MGNSNEVTGATEVLITQNTLNYFKQRLNIYHKTRRTNYYTALNSGAY